MGPAGQRFCGRVLSGVSVCKWRVRRGPAEQFWIVKHGVKMTGMPAWGITHDDELWEVVAFVRKLQELTPEQYETLVKTSPKHEELMQDMKMESDAKQNGEYKHE